MTAPANHSLAQALGRTAEEVARCRAIVLRVEAAVHGLADAGQLPRDARMTELQAIDLLDQRLDDLARWLLSLSGHCGPQQLPVPAMADLSTLRLAELRHALAGREMPAGQPAGGAELF